MKSCINISKKSHQKKYAEKLIGRILFLEGVPVVHRSTDSYRVRCREAVENDRVAETDAIAAYNNAIALAGEVKTLPHVIFFRRF